MNNTLHCLLWEQKRTKKWDSNPATYDYWASFLYCFQLIKVIIHLYRYSSCICSSMSPSWCLFICPWNKMIQTKNKWLVILDLSGHFWWRHHSNRATECLITCNFSGFSRSFCVQMRLNRRDAGVFYPEALGKINGDPVKANHLKNRFHLTLCAKHCILWQHSRRGNRWWVDKIRETPWIAITALK